MPRYLTPSKIALLCLIELYTDADLPSAATIPILSFILNQILPLAPAEEDAQHIPALSAQDLPFAFELKSFESLLSPHQSASAVPGRTLWDRFLAKLWDIDSLDALFLFFAGRSSLLARTREDAKKDSAMGVPPPSPDKIILSRTSPLGSFVRKAKLVFDRLRFENAQLLWTAFMRWRHGSRTYWARRNGILSRWAGHKVLDDGEDEWGQEATEMLELVACGGLTIGDEGRGRVSVDDAKKLLDFQVELMEKGNRIPVEVKDKFNIHGSIKIPRLTHYLNFLDAWRAGDYSTSFDHLHQSSDYRPRKRSRSFYPYALMNLAVLQADFGCLDEAVAAMLETVSTARENGDMSCLNTALNWLYHFGKAHPKVIREIESTNMTGVDRGNLAYLRMMAKETGMWELWGSTLLSEAKLGMSNGESVAVAFENTVKSSHLIIEKNMKTMMGHQMAMVSHMWARSGVTRLGRQYCEIFLNCHSRYAFFDDTLRHTCRVAHLLTEKGRYDEAMERLEGLDANSLRSWKSNQYLLKYRGILRLKRDLHRNNLDGADQLLAQLLQSNGDDADPDLNFEISVLHIEYLVRRTDFSAALGKIEKLAAEMKEDGADISLRVKLLTMKALIQDKCGRPQKGFSVAVRAASIAWRARLLPGLWGAMGAIANILTSLSEFHASSRILVAIIPRALECEQCSLSAQLYSFLVDAYMGIAGEAKAGSLERREYMIKCLEFIDRSFNEYSALEDTRGKCEMMAKKATIMKVLGDRVQANDSADVYLELKREAAALAMT